MDKTDKFVLQQIKTVLNLGSQEINDDCRLVEDLGANSFELAEIFLSLEEEFNISLGNKFMLGKTIYVKTIKDIVNEALGNNA
jgi:acyl carrier protein